MQGNSTTSRLAHTSAEINGIPGVIWGNVVVPTTGSSSIKINTVMLLS